MDAGIPVDDGDTAVSDEKQNYIGETISVSDGTDYPKAEALMFVLFALAMSIFLVSLDLTIIATAIPRMTDEFHSLDDGQC